MRLTKFSLAALLAACALAAATPGSKKADSSSLSSDSSSDSSADSHSDSHSSSSSDSSSSSSSSEDHSHGRHHHHHHHMKHHKYMAPWQYQGDSYWHGGPSDYHLYEKWKHGHKHLFYDGVYVLVDDEYKKVSALITFFLPSGKPHIAYVRKGCTAVGHKVNLVTVAPLNSLGKVKTTFYASMHDCESGKNPIKKIGTDTVADLDGKTVGAVKVKVPKKHTKSRKRKEHKKGKGHEN